MISQPEGAVDQPHVLFPWVCDVTWHESIHLHLPACCLLCLVPIVIVHDHDREHDREYDMYGHQRILCHLHLPAWGLLRLDLTIHFPSSEWHMCSCWNGHDIHYLCVAYGDRTSCRHAHMHSHDCGNPWQLQQCDHMEDLHLNIRLWNMGHCEN